MKRMLVSLGAFGILLLLVTPVFGADPALSPVGKILDQEIVMLEHEFVPLADAMPADKYGFAPTEGEFKGVRTFGAQLKHAAANIYAASAGILEEKMTPAMGDGDNAPASVVTKDDIMKYLKDGLVYAHKAMAKLTPGNLADTVAVPWGKSTRLALANLAVWHTFDHYGQLVVYLRMNGIIPPASRPRK